MTGPGCFKCGGNHMARECRWTAELEPGTVYCSCRWCRAPGAACAKHPCAQCGVPVAHHTEAGIIECAWRGQPCTGCGKPPHPDWHITRTASCDHPSDADIPAARRRLLPGPDRCERYAHPDDTAERRAIRARTPWRRMAAPDTFYLGPKVRPPAAATVLAVPAGDPPRMIREPAELEGMNVAQLAAEMRDLRAHAPAPRERSDEERAALRDLAARQAAQSRRRRGAP